MIEMNLKSSRLPLWSQVPLCIQAVGLRWYLKKVGAVLQSHFTIHSEALISSVREQNTLMVLCQRMCI